MTRNEMIEQRINLQEELENLIKNGEAENRELNETENSRLAEIRTSIESLNEQIAKEDEEARKIAEKANNNQNKSEQRTMIKLSNLIKGVIGDYQMNDEERAMVNGSKISYRTLVASGATKGQETVAEDKKRLDIAVRNASVLSKLGATVFSNAEGDISLPRYSGSNCGWAGEISDAVSGDGTFSEVVLQPKRLTAYLAVSKTLLAQNSEDLEAILIADLADAISEKLDETIFGDSTGSTTQPAGLFADTGYTTTGATAISGLTYKDVLSVEQGVEEKNGTNFIFVTSPSVKYALKGTQTASGLQMVYDGSEIDGYKTIVSNSVKKNGLIALDPRDLAAAFWNNIDITVDPYTLAASNQVKLVVNFYCDCKLRGDRIVAEIFNAE